MGKITEKDYQYAKQRIEQLLMTVEDSEEGMESPEGKELVRMSDIVIEYEKTFFPIQKPTFDLQIHLDAASCIAMDETEI